MADKQTYTGLSKKQVSCEPYSMTSVEFFDTKPNYFRVSNHGTGRLYCGVSKLPTQNDYDFMCEGENIKMFSEPFRRPYLYILNPTGNTVLVDVLSFYAEFDPLALAFSEIKLDLSGTSFETTTAIDSFNTPLPAGTNNIGKVNVANWPSDYAKAANQKDYTSVLANILSGVGGINAGWTADNITAAIDNLSVLATYLDSLSKSYNRFYSGTAVSGGTTFTPDETYRWTEIAFFSNDSENDLTIQTIESDGANYTMTIKAGEVLNNIKCRCPSIVVAGSGDYRMALIERSA